MNKIEFERNAYIAFLRLHIRWGTYFDQNGRFLCQSDDAREAEEQLMQLLKQEKL